MIDLRDILSVEFVVDQKGKVWLNVNGECVFRAAYSQAVSVDLPARRYPQYDAQGLIVLAFPRGEYSVSADRPSGDI